MKQLLELLRSMRFAVAILAVVALASTIGSVLEQAQPAVRYVGSYGEFWASLFQLAGLTDIYRASWFALLLVVMAAATALGLLQHTPQMLYEMRTLREHKSLAALRRLPQHAELALAAPPAAAAARLGRWLTRSGYRWRQRRLADGSLLLAASRGMARRAGYLLVHAAIVLICVGGLVDGNLGLRWQLWRGDKLLERRDLAPAAVPPASRLAPGSGAFRGAFSLAEGEQGASVLLAQGDGFLVQDLPFAVRLKQFRIEHYAEAGVPAGAGRPSDFVSEIEIVDGARRIPATLRVNHPFSYRGVTLYQSGFADGGSTLQLQLWHNGRPHALQGKVGASVALLLDGEPYTLELDEWRANNVLERDAGAGPALEDVGPSLAFRLRDKSGQAAHWLVYRNPIRFDGALYAVSGRRASDGASMRYSRIPLDADGSSAGYQRFTAALAGGAARAALVRPGDALAGPSAVLLDAFVAGGYRGLAELVRRAVPAAEQVRAGQLYVTLLEQALGRLLAGTGGPPVRALMDAYSEAIEQGMPLQVSIGAVQQRNASVLQVAYAPGAWLVYLGCALLSAGVCCMYFVRERRLWLVLDAARGSLLAAYSGNRDSPALPREFEQHCAALAAICQSS